MNYPAPQQAQPLHGPSEGLQGRLGLTVANEVETVNMLKQILVRLRGQVPEETGTKPPSPAAREIPLLEHLQTLESLQIDSRRLVGEIANIV